MRTGGSAHVVTASQRHSPPLKRGLTLVRCPAFVRGCPFYDRTAIAVLPLARLLAAIAVANAACAACRDRQVAFHLMLN